MVKPQGTGNQPVAGHNGHGPGPFSFLNVPGAGQSLSDRARRVRLLLTDCDGVLTDGAVYYSARGEELKRFSIRDGMGVERLRELVGVEVGIISGEESTSLRRRAEKLGIDELHLGVKDKLAALQDILQRYGLEADQVAYIGDDVNDVEVMRRVGLSGSPADATIFAREVACYVCANRGGQGAFREFAEFIIASKASYDTETLQRIYERVAHAAAAPGGQ